MVDTLVLNNSSFVDLTNEELLAVDAGGALFGAFQLGCAIVAGGALVFAAVSTGGAACATPSFWTAAAGTVALGVSGAYQATH